MATALARAGCQEGMSHCLPAVAAQVCPFPRNVIDHIPISILMHPAMPCYSYDLSRSMTARFWACSCCTDALAWYITLPLGGKCTCWATYLEAFAGCTAQIKEAIAGPHGKARPRAHFPEALNVRPPTCPCAALPLNCHAKKLTVLHIPYSKCACLASCEVGDDAAVLLINITAWSSRPTPRDARRAHAACMRATTERPSRR